MSALVKTNKKHHIYAVEGYILSILGPDAFISIPQSMIDMILFYYAAEIILLVSNGSKQNHISYSFIDDDWNTLEQKILHIFQISLSYSLTDLEYVSNESQYHILTKNNFEHQIDSIVNHNNEILLNFHVAEDATAPQQIIDMFNAQGQNNTICADCNTEIKDSVWIVWNHGIFVCIYCAGIHRQFGIHISQVRSAELDVFRKYQIKLMKSVGGNFKANKMLERRKPKYFIQPSEHRRYFISAKYEKKLFQQSDYGIHEMPQKVQIGFVFQTNNQKKIYIQLLGRYLFFYKKGTDSYPIQCYDVTKINVILSEVYSKIHSHVLNINSIDNSSCTTVYRDCSKHILDWTHSIRKAKQYYFYLDANDNKHIYSTQSQPLRELNIQNVESGVVLGIALKKGERTHIWWRKWWVLLNGYLYWFANDFRTNPKLKGIPEGYVSLFDADIVKDMFMDRINKQNVLLICTPNVTYYLQPMDTIFYQTVNSCCNDLRNTRSFDFVKNQFIE